MARRIVEHLFEKSAGEAAQQPGGEEIFVEFSVHEIKKIYEVLADLFDPKITIADVEDALFYLSKTEAIKIEGGFLILYNRLSIQRIETDNRKRYTKDDYQKLQLFYDNKVAKIHIIGEYAKKMMSDHQAALQFADDYFQLNYDAFLRKYFPGKNAETLTLKMTPAKFRQLFGQLSPAQLRIVNDKDFKIYPSGRRARKRQDKTSGTQTRIPIAYGGCAPRTTPHGHLLQGCRV